MTLTRIYSHIAILQPLIRRTTLCRPSIEAPVVHAHKPDGEYPGSISVPLGLALDGPTLKSSISRFFVPCLFIRLNVQHSGVIEVRGLSFPYHTRTCQMSEFHQYLHVRFHLIFFLRLSSCRCWELKNLGYICIDDNQIFPIESGYGF